MDLKAFSQRHQRYVIEKDFVEDPGMGHLCSLLHSEVSELYEAARKGRLSKESDHADAMEAAGCRRMLCGEEELADIMIRCIHTARVLGVDLEEAILSKMAFNESRPWRHGGKLV